MFEQYGTPKLDNLTLPDLLALLTNGDQQGNGVKPKKKTETIQRVRDLSSAQVAISRCDLAVAVGVVGAYPNALAPALARAPSLLHP